MPIFVLNSESVKNSHHFYLLNEGGDFSRFEANPVMLDCHDLTKLLGRWVDLKIEGSNLVATPEFDLEDADAAKRAGQVERGFLKGASVGIIIHEAEYRFNATTSREEIYVTRWELFEASIVTVPSNAGALTLKVYDSRTETAIADDLIQTHVTEIVKLSLNNKSMTKTNLTAEALVALGLADTATPAELSTAIVALKAAGITKDEQIATLKKEADDAVDKRNGAMIDLAIKEGRATESQRATLLSFASSDFEGCAAILASKESKPSIADSITPVSLGAERKEWSYFDWKNNDPQGLEKLEINSPAEYSRITKKLK